MEDNINLSHLGPAVPLFFDFIKLSIVFLLIIGLISGLLITIRGFLGESCSQNSNCTPTWYTYFSIANISKSD